MRKLNKNESFHQVFFKALDHRCRRAILHQELHGYELSVVTLYRTTLFVENPMKSFTGICQTILWKI